MRQGCRRGDKEASEKGHLAESILSIILRSEDKASGYSVSRGLEAC